MPTLAELTGTNAREDTREDTDGISFAPTLLGKGTIGRSQEQHEFLYWQDPKWEAVRMENWKAVRSKENASFELYDLSVDLGELNDVSGQNLEVLQQIKEFTQGAVTPIRSGKILDPSVGFKKRKKQ